jgi:hypothetical protein
MIGNPHKLAKCIGALDPPTAILIVRSAVRVIDKSALRKSSQLGGRSEY